jgi:hypothetical protein
VGYDDARPTAGGPGAFRVVNSWWTDRGERGYFWISYEAVKSAVTSCGHALRATDRSRHEPHLAARIRTRHVDRHNTIVCVGLLGETAGAVLRFFDFRPMSTRNNAPFPDSVFLLDVTDLALEPHGSNAAVFPRLETKLPESDASGVRTSAAKTPFVVSGGAPGAELDVLLQ